MNENGTYWVCENLQGGTIRMRHLLNYPDVTVKLKPGSLALVKEGVSVAFHCDVPIRESWQSTEFVDSFLGKTAIFIRNGSICTTTGTVLNSYNATCSLPQGRFSVTLLTTSSWYDGKTITCRAQFGSGIKAEDKYFEAASTISISDQNKLNISPASVTFDSGMSVTLSCFLNEHQAEVIWYINSAVFRRVAAANTSESCSESTAQDREFEYRCTMDSRLFELVILPKFVTYGLNNASWTCGSSDSTESNTATFRITGFPEISTSASMLCMSPGTVILNCSLSTASREYVKEAVWYHHVNSNLIRTINGTWDGVSFKLQIPFCNIEDYGVYTCLMKTELPNLKTLKKDVTLSVSGPPLFIDKTSSKSVASVDLTATFYSYSTTDLPIWRFQNRTLIPGTKYSTTTSKKQIKTIFYNKEVTLNGFISTLKTFEYDDEDDGEYTVTVQNSGSSVTETITVRFSHVSENQEQSQIGYSGGILAGVAVGCIVGTLITVFATYVVVKKLRSHRKAKEDEPRKDQNYDELGMRNLPSVYDTVQQS